MVQESTALLSAKIAKTNLKLNCYIEKIALQTEATQAKKIRTNFESGYVIRLLDARRLLDHQHIHKAINPAVTTNNMVACNNKKRGSSIGNKIILYHCISLSTIAGKIICCDIICGVLNLFRAS